MDIELANQLIAMPIATHQEEKQEDTDESIGQSHEAQLEKYQQQQFVGYLIPPSGKWKGNNKDAEMNEKYKQVNTKILKRFGDDVYMQDKQLSAFIFSIMHQI